VAGILGSVEATIKALGKTPWMGRVGTYAFPPDKASNLIYTQFYKSNFLGVRIFEFFQTHGITYYVTSLLAQYGGRAREHMPEGYSLSEEHLP
jgi:hypothetical protein